MGDGDFVLSIQNLEETKEGYTPKLTIDRLIGKVAEDYSLGMEAIRGNKRSKAICEARALIAYLSAVRLGLSFAEVARCLNLNRSSVARMAQKGGKIASRIDINKWLMS